MATKETREWKGKVTHRYRIRMRGFKFDESWDCTGKDGCKGGCTGGKKGADWAATTEQDIKAGRAVAASKYTLGEAIAYFCADRKNSPLHERYESEAQREKIKNQLAWWQARLGKDRKLSDIRKQDILDAKVALQEGGKVVEINGQKGPGSPSGRPLSGASLNRYHVVLSVLWGVARNTLGWVEHSPFEGVGKISEKKRARKRWLNVDEQNALLAEAAKGIKDPQKTKLWILAGLTTGCRLSEIARITWADINLTEGTIRIDVTKNGQPRVVVIGPELRAALEEIKARKVVPAKPFGRFPRVAYFNALKRAGLQGEGPKGRVVFHSLRHSCATILGPELGARELMGLMGWETLAMAQRYCHASDHVSDKVKNAVAKMR